MCECVFAGSDLRPCCHVATRLRPSHLFWNEWTVLYGGPRVTSWFPWNVSVSQLQTGPLWLDRSTLSPEPWILRRRTPNPGSVHPWLTWPTSCGPTRASGSPGSSTSSTACPPWKSVENPIVFLCFEVLQSGYYSVHRECCWSRPSVAASFRCGWDCSASEPAVCSGRAGERRSFYFILNLVLEARRGMSSA